MDLSETTGVLCVLCGSFIVQYRKRITNHRHVELDFGSPIYNPCNCSCFVYDKENKTRNNDSFGLQCG